MKLSFWSDKNKWFVPRTIGLGYSLNLKYVAKRLGWIRSSANPTPSKTGPADAISAEPARTEEDRLRQQIEASKYEART